MKLREQSISGLHIILPDFHHDERGVFRRSFCQKELERNGIRFEVRQGNLSENFKKHTLRGFHYQIEPAEESKILTCVTGVLYNVVLDLRRDSVTYKWWVALEISAESRESIHVPAGCANAFLTMVDQTVVHYYMSNFFRPDSYHGIRFNDPTFNFEWPFTPAVISEKDLNFPDYRDN